MKLKDLLTKPKFEECIVVAGDGGLDVDVRSVGMLDSPDVIEYLKRGSLLLTTGYVLRDNLSAFESLIQKMATRGCAGLGIKTNRYITSIPKRLIDVANAQQLTVIELPFQYALNEMVYSAIESILEKKTEELSFALDLYDRFTDILLEGSGLQPIVDNLSQLTERHVWVFDSDVNLVTESQEMTCDSHKFSIIQRNLINLALRGNMRIGRILSFSLWPGESSEDMCISVYPVRILQRFGFIVLNGFLSEPPSWLTTALRQSASVIAFELVRLDAVRERELRFKNEFLNDLLDGQFPTDQEIAHRGSQFGLEADGKYRVVVSKLDYSPPRRSYPEEYWEFVVPLVQHFSHLDDFSPIVFFKNDYLVILCPEYPLNSDNQARLISLLTQMNQSLRTSWGVSMVSGISNRVDRLKDLPVAFSQSIEILRVGTLTRPDECVHTFRAQTTVDLLRLIPMKDLLAFRDTVLEGFRDSVERSALLQTLYVYLRNQCSVAKTAAKLYIHRNTVNYRIEKCRQLFGIDFRDSDEAMQIQLAILIDTVIASDRR